MQSDRMEEILEQAKNRNSKAESERRTLQEESQQRQLLFTTPAVVIDTAQNRKLEEVLKKRKE